MPEISIGPSGRIHITALSGIGVASPRTTAANSFSGMEYGEPGAGVKDPSRFTSAEMNWTFELAVTAGPKISGAVGDARMFPPRRNGFVLLSIAVTVPSCIKNVPAVE